ncbi:flagellar hook-length control protein FliK [Neobacillus mesonae]|uniref:flagellar hook-length control protein FliK n=1 Tax=Neobacillus mesonae TaxID=1193713 RepID=UPI002E1EE625|nr:flagellar hook-length control protein FliK [Neobacillus mesonae]
MADLVQLSGIQTITMNQQGKVAEKEKEEASAGTFERLLELIGQQEDQDSEPMGEANTGLVSSFLQQNAVISPILLSALTGEKPQIDLMQDSPEKAIPEHLLPQTAKREPTITKELLNHIVRHAEITVQNGQGAEPRTEVFFQVKDGANPKVLQKERKITTVQMVPQVDAKQKELNQPIQSDGNHHPDPINIMNPTTSSHVTSGEKQAPVETVRAANFKQDIQQIIQSAIHVTESDDGFEAMFTLAPKHLGKVDVKVTIQDGQVTAEFLTSTPLGKDLLETHVQALRSSLETQGLQVAKIDISQQPASTTTNLLGTFSQSSGDFHGRQGQQGSRKRSEQHLIQSEDKTRDYDIHTDWVSQINTTA